MDKMAKEGAGPIKQHQRLARHGGDPQEHESFGVLPHNHSHKPHSEPKGGRKALKSDHERGIRKPNGYHPQPDHGPFHEE